MVDSPAALARLVEKAALAAIAAASAQARPALGVPSRSAPLDIAVPIFNNAALLGRCLELLLPTLSADDEVWLIDDASDDIAIPAILHEFSQKWPATHCVRNTENLGFVGASNRAIRMTRRDLVLLNSDTEVTEGWLEHLQACLAVNPQAGIVCPLSDRATILSVIPPAKHLTKTELAAAAAALTTGDAPLPTAVGFCMLMRRQMLDQIGVFSQVFSPGYGEENDLSMRALKAGWDILAADRACVFHHSGGSFAADQIPVLQREHQARLDRIWPEYAPLVQSWWRDNPLRVKTERMASHGDQREAIVHVLHRQYLIGGTERVVRTLLRGLGEQYRQTLIYPGETGGAWCDVELRATDPCRELMLNTRWIRPANRIGGHGADMTCPQSERALARIVQGSGGRIVHFHHMLHWDSLMLPAVARAMGCRVVISVHDFWFNCPIHNQLEYLSGQPCGRSHAHADERCANCLSAYGLEPRAAAEYSGARHALIAEMLRQADAVIVPSQFIRRKLLAAYPTTPERQLHVQPHGVGLPESPAAYGPGPTRVLAYFGGDQVLKGVELVLHLARALTDSDLTFRIHGRIKGLDPESVPGNVELHGFYNPDDVSRVMQGVDLALVPSYYEESFSMVTSECWAHGVPVLASSRGALPERVIPGVNGWLVPEMKPESWVRAVREVLHGDTIERCRERLSRQAVTSIEQSVQTLDRVYRNLLNLPAPDPLPVRPAAAQLRFRRKLEALRAGTGPKTRPAGHRCLGVLRDHWGTANYRVRFPLQDLARSAVSECSDFHVIRKAGFELGPALEKTGARHVVVQPFLSDEGLGLMEYLHRHTGFQVTLVVDDLWTGLQKDNPARASLPNDVPGRLGYAASLSHSLVLTTHELQRRLGLKHENTHVINNALPQWVWGSFATAPENSHGRLRIGWCGAPQHAADLAFLEPVIRNTADLADWVFLGMCPEALRPLASEVYPMVPFDRYPAALAGLRLDLAIAPLTDHPFNRCKSHLKVLECGILGMAMVASDLEPYRHCPVPLARPDDPEDWTANIRALLLDHEARMELGRSLRRWVLRHHLTENRRPDWQTALGIDAHAE